MKKIRFTLIFPIALFVLFISFQCLIAQTTSITGTVYENSHSKTVFRIPEGTIQLYLPDDMRSRDRISGTVISELAGKNDKERRKNLSRMERYNLTFPDGSEFSPRFDNDGVLVVQNFSEMEVPVADRFDIALLNAEGILVTQSEVPLMPSQPALDTHNVVRLARKVIDNSEPVVLLCNSDRIDDKAVFLTPFTSPDEFNDFTDQIRLGLITASPRKQVYRVPEGLSGQFNVFVETPDGEVERIDLISVASINASIDKSNLMRNETAKLEVVVSGLTDVPFQPVRMYLDNHTPGIIKFPEGDHRKIDLNISGYRIESEDVSSLRIEQEVVGVVPGSFLIDATLVSPPTAFENGIQPFFEEITDAVTFDRAIGALGDDIERFVRLESDQEMNDFLIGTRSHLKPVSAFQSLEEGIAYTINLFNPLVYSGRGYEFFHKMDLLGNILPEVLQLYSQPQPAHPLYNFAGRFVEETSLLLINSECHEELLDYLNAEMEDNGLFNIEIFNGKQIESYTGITLQEAGSMKPSEPNTLKGRGSVSSPEQTNPENKGGDLGGGIAKSGNSGEARARATTISDEQPPIDSVAEQESPPAAKDPTFFKDKQGKEYIFYRDAECHLLLKGSESPCSEEYTWDENKKGDPTGKYMKWVWMDSNSCRQGTGFCTGMKQVRSIKYVYDDKNCDRLINIETFEGYNCPLP